MKTIVLTNEMEPTIAKPSYYLFGLKAQEQE
jgi:hypothetical protein